MIKIQEMTKKLQEERAKSMAHDAVYHVLALRRRSRRNITLRGLVHRMRREGFDNFKDQEYASVLEGLAGLGLGKLQRDLGGKVVAVSDIRTTLDSIGKAACGQSASLKSFPQRNKFVPIVRDTKNPVRDAIFAVDRENQMRQLQEVEKPKLPLYDMKDTTPLTMLFEGTPITIMVPRSMEATHLLALIRTLNAKS